MITIALMAAAAASAPGDSTLVFDCDMRTPEGEGFALRGAYGDDGFETDPVDQVELTSEARFEGGLQLGIEDHVFSYRWTAAGDGRGDVDVEMVEYARQNAAVLTIVRRRSDGRHVGFTLIGTGMCETSRQENGQ